MKPIVRETYRDIEWHMHNLPRLRRIASSKRADILHGSVGVDYNTPTGHSKHADSTAILGMKLAEGCDVGEWVAAIEKTHAYFEGMPESKILYMFYTENHKIEDVAKALGLSRQSIGNMRDNVVNRCALHAAAYGLISLDGEATGNAYR